MKISMTKCFLSSVMISVNTWKLNTLITIISGILEYGSRHSAVVAQNNGGPCTGLESECLTTSLIYCIKFVLFFIYDLSGIFYTSFKTTKRTPTSEYGKLS